MATKLTKTQADTAAAEFDALDAQIKDLTKKRDALKVKLLAFAAANKDKAETANYRVVRIPAYRFDAEKVQRAFPPTKYPDFYKLAVDTEAVKAEIPENKRRPLQTPSYSLSVTEL